jgi:CRISPR/Cas system-associated protein Cas10 (large subunit of type III CRISPR-Cas system)
MDRPHCYYNCESKSDSSWYDKVYDQLGDIMRPDDKGDFEDGEFTCPVCGTVMSVRIEMEPQFDCRVKEKHAPNNIK